ncbi:MAG: hypothetical protein NHB14_06460 [Desulfosporosinus sp.]|nr:hypothetical protein [Desulfosporosinus sp.]
MKKPRWYAIFAMNIFSLMLKSYGKFGRGRDVAPLTLGAVAIALDFEASVGKPLGGSACEPLPRWHFEIQVRLTRLRLKGSLRKITPSGLGKEVDFKYEKARTNVGLLIH